MKILFIPFRIASGLIAGFTAKKLFEQAWGAIDDDEPPQPEHRYGTLGKVVLAAALQGAIFTAVRAAVDHQARRAFAGLTGSWPGEEAAERE